ncbi:MAG: excinuclease ABC subunit UvrA, partial [Limisphaerales bacterium]
GKGCVCFVIAPAPASEVTQHSEAAAHGTSGGRRRGEPTLNTQLLPHSTGWHCAHCDLDITPPSAGLFSFNHPLGACPTCRGFGRIITIDYNIVIPDRAKTLAQGPIRPWQTGHGAESQQDLLKFCKLRKVPLNISFQDLPKNLQEWVINGDADYGKNAAHEWPRAWYGVKGYFRWLESKAYKMHVRVLLSRYRSYTKCPECNGMRFQAETLGFTISDLPFRGRNPPGPENQKWGMNIAEFYQLSIHAARRFVESIISTRKKLNPSDPLTLALNEVHARLGYLEEVGLGYLTLDRSMRSLSGGETERVNLTTCLGSRLVNALFVLDEPSVGLHARDTE